MTKKPQAEFVCNIPGEPRDNLIEICRDGITAAGPKIMVDVEPEWERYGDNLIGPAYGATPRPGDVGIYYLPLH